MHGIVALLVCLHDRGGPRDEAGQSREPTTTRMGLSGTAASLRRRDCSHLPSQALSMGEEGCARRAISLLACRVRCSCELGASWHRARTRRRMEASVLGWGRAIRACPACFPYEHSPVSIGKRCGVQPGGGRRINIQYSAITI